MIEQKHDGKWAVGCEGGCARPLAFDASTRSHAENTQRKHYREHHPGVPAPCDRVAEETPGTYDGPPLLLDVTAAARAYLRHQHREAAAVWAALVGCDPRDTAKMTDTAEAARDHGSLLGYVPPL